MRYRGFTLIELTIVAGVIAILAALALPGYQDSLRRAGRLDARLALLRIQYLQERHFAQHNAYASELAELAAAPQDANYRFELTADAAHHTWVATAHARDDGRQSRDVHCLWLSIDAAGRRRSSSSGNEWDADTQRCWG